MTFDPDKLYRDVLEAGEIWADQKAAYEAFEDNSKSVLADLVTEILPAYKSRIEAEMVALSSESYKAHLREKQAARRAFLVAQVRYKSLEMLAELRRTQESTRRVEMRMQ